MDSNGDIYVADEGNDRVEKLDSSGNYLSQIDGIVGNILYFAAPSGVAVDSNGDVYVTDLNGDLDKYDANGNFVWAVGHGCDASCLNSVYFGSGPQGVAVGSNGDVYATDQSNNLVWIFDSSGNYLSQFGSSGTGNGQFSQPLGVAVNSGGDVYVTDAGNDRVEKFDSSGNYLSQFGSSGTGNGQFNKPFGVAVYPDGLVGVVDSNNKRVETFGQAAIITTQPADQTVNAGQNATFSATAIGTPTPTVQWQVSTDGGNTFTKLSDQGNVSGSTTPTLLITATTAGQNASQYRAVFTNLLSLAVTEAATLTSDATSAPTGVAAVADSSTTATVSWNAVAGAARYNILRSTTGMAGSYIYCKNVTTLNWTNVGLSPASTYFYEVVTVVGTGTATQVSSPSTAASVTTEAVPSAPTGVTATPGSSDAQLNVSWNSVTGATSYTVSRATTSGGPYTTLSRQAGTTYVNNGLSPGTRYYYVVTATTSIGTSANSSQATAATLAQPVAPTVTATVASTTSAHVSWTAVTATGSTGPTTYDVYSSTTPGGPYTLRAVLSTLSWPNNGLTHGTTYYYVVRAVVPGVGMSPLSAQVSATP